MNRARNLLGLAALLVLGYAIGRLPSSQDGSNIFAAAADDSHAPTPSLQPTAASPAAARAALRDLSQPAGHHRYLEALVGDWKAEVVMREREGAPPLAMTATVHREWVLDGRFIRETVEASGDAAGFRGIGYIGYNRLDGQYELIWMENMSTEIMFERGSFDPETMIFTTIGNHRDPITGRMRATRSTLDLSNPDRHVFAARTTGTDGREFTSFEGVLERVEKSE